MDTAEYDELLALNVSTLSPVSPHWSTRSTLSTVDKVEHVEFDFVASVYLAFEYIRILSRPSSHCSWMC